MLPVTALLRKADPSFDGGPNPRALQEFLDEVLALEPVARTFAETRGRRPTEKQMKTLERAYRRFRESIALLQATANPPPQLPLLETEGPPITPWDQWLLPLYFEDEKATGRPESCDWRRITKLLALYETALGRRASGSVTAFAPGPTLRFLEAALSSARASQPNAVQFTAFRTPGADALRKKLRRLRPWIDAARARLEERLRA